MISYHRHEENREIDRKADAPQDRTQRGPLAEIGEDIGNPHNQEEDRQFIDEALRAGAKFREQHGDGAEREGLAAVLVRAERAGPKRLVIERGIAWPGVIEAAKP